MKTISLAVALIAAISVSACVRAPYRNPVEDVRILSYAAVSTYAEQGAEFILKHGNEKMIGAALDSVKRSLKDPDSAKFDGVRMVKYQSGNVVCGSVNAKNSYGGYTGFKPFVAGPHGATLHDTSTRYAHINEASNAGIVDACHMR